MEETLTRWRCPNDREYHREHLWLRREGAHVVVGVTDYLQDTAGSILFVQLPEPGSPVREGTPLFSLEAAKWVGHFDAPLAGRVVGVNEALRNRPALVNADCYGQGWLVKVAPEGGRGASLLSAGEYMRYLEELAAAEEGWAR